MAVLTVLTVLDESQKERMFSGYKEINVFRFVYQLKSDLNNETRF